MKKPLFQHVPVSYLTTILGGSLLLMVVILTFSFYFYTREKGKCAVPLSHLNQEAHESMRAGSTIVPFRDEDLSLLRKETVFSSSPFVENDSLPAPTNQWFSSVAFSRSSEPLFAYPLAVKMNEDGFGISLPSVVSTEDTVFGSYVPDITATLSGGNVDSSVSQFDDLSVLIAEKRGLETLASLRVTHGSPFVFARVSPRLTISLRMSGSTLREEGEGFFVFDIGGKIFGVFFENGEIRARKGSEGSLELSTADTETDISFAVLPNRESLPIFRRVALDPIVGTEADHFLSESRAKSRFEIRTRGGGETLFALLPKHRRELEEGGANVDSIGNYQTLRGKQTLLFGKSFSFSRPIDVPPLALPLDRLTEVDRETIRGLVREDSSRISISEKDTYFLGKKLFAIAHLLDLAAQLGMDAERELLRTTLSKELNTWRINTFSGEGSGQYFSYDPLVKGVVGIPSSFGSDEFNDHHFHYGYFIAAASILSRHDPEYLLENERFVTLLVKDIENPDRGEKSFPYLRGFDAYEGHSWASGTQPFADGNNQESSSEAVHARYAVYLWSQVTGNEALRNRSLALFSEEYSSALEYWFGVDHSDPRFASFGHGFVSLVWGGKLDSATWFSARPEAKLGINILPVSPAMGYLGHDSAIGSKILRSEPEFEKPELFKDSLAAYRAFSDSARARREIAALRPEDIDGAHTKSFLMAWVMTLPFLPIDR